MINLNKRIKIPVTLWKLTVIVDKKSSSEMWGSFKYLSLILFMDFLCLWAEDYLGDKKNQWPNDLVANKFLFEQ